MNLVGFLLQMFVVSRVFKFLGVGKSLFIHPLVALVGYLMMLRAPSVQLMGMLKVADNSLDYSLGNTTKQALWLPTSREAKYKAKQAVDSFFVRAGDVIQAGVVFVGERLVLAVPAFAAINVVLVGAWLGRGGCSTCPCDARPKRRGPKLFDTVQSSRETSLFLIRTEGE